MTNLKHFDRVVLLVVTAMSCRVCGDEIATDFRGDLNVAEVARFGDLPTRMYLLPEFLDPVGRVVLSDGLVPLFVRILNGDYDDELYRDAARSLERVAREFPNQADQYADALRNRLAKTSSQAVIDACAMALVAANDKSSADLLATFCGPANEGLSIHVEPRLAEWKHRVLVEQWRERIRNPFDHTRQMTALACRCLAEVGDTESTDVLVKLALDERLETVVRGAAARAVSRLDPGKAGATSGNLAVEDIPSRLLAIAFLETATSGESLEQLLSFCEDPEDAVASRSWHTLSITNPAALVDKLERGVVHEDANVRHGAISVMQQLPTRQHCVWLMEMLGDEHLFVRNDARAALNKVAATDADLRLEILAIAGGVLQKQDASWQQIEQTLLLLGQQSCGDYQSACVPLLSHQRNEVMVTAAWLLHLMPRPELAQDISKHAGIVWRLLSNVASDIDDLRRQSLSEQLIFLFHHAASTRDAGMVEVATEMFNKKAPTFPEARAAGLWALGFIKTGADDEVLRGKFVARVFDDSTVEPEMIVVKAASAYALGQIGMKVSLADLRKAHEQYGNHGILGKCVGKAIHLLGEDCEPAGEPGPVGASQWPVFPSGVPSSDDAG